MPTVNINMSSLEAKLLVIISVILTDFKTVIFYHS